MAFEFPLEPVLRLRKSYERLERLRLLTIAAMIVRVKDEMAAAAREDANVKLARRDSLAQGILAAEIQLEVASEKARARRNVELAEKLMVLQRTHAKQARAYQMARRRHDIFERLREAKLREYKLLEARREQRLLDDLFLMRMFVPTE